jgi:hypothetical protein
MTWPRLSLASWLAAGAALALGCTDPQCPGDESFVVTESGTCSVAPLQFTLGGGRCRVDVTSPTGMTGLPQKGAMGPHPVPLREGGFILYDDLPSFRMCRARRVDYRLELSCFDGKGDGVCQASLTEPGP